MTNEAASKKIGVQLGPWLRTTTGITVRHISAPGEVTPLTWLQPHVFIKFLSKKERDEDKIVTPSKGPGASDPHKRRVPSPMKTISRDELASLLGSPRLTVVNVLAAGAYEKIHIKGSTSIPRNELEKGRWTELDRTKLIVVHCSSYECEASRIAARFLEGKGFDVRAYEGGMKEWAEADLPTEGTVSARRFVKERYGKPEAR